LYSKISDKYGEYFLLHFQEMEQKFLFNKDLFFVFNDLPVLEQSWRLLLKVLRGERYLSIHTFKEEREILLNNSMFFLRRRLFIFFLGQGQAV